MKSLYALKHWYTRRLGFLVEASQRRGISPDVWTAVGVVAAAGAAWTIVEGWWLATFVLLAARLAGANLDGAVARARGVARPFGFVLNEIGDRLSDLLVMTGLVLLSVRVGTPAMTTTLLLVAAIAATLPTFISLSAAGAGAPRLNGGPFGKTERCLTAVVAAAFPQHLDIIAWVIIVGSLLTAILRLVSTARALGGQGDSQEYTHGDVQSDEPEHDQGYDPGCHQGHDPSHNSGHEAARSPGDKQVPAPAHGKEHEPGHDPSQGQQLNKEPTSAHDRQHNQPHNESRSQS